MKLKLNPLPIDVDQLHDGYWYNGELVTTPDQSVPVPLKAPTSEYYWQPELGSTIKKQNYVHTPSGRIVCNIYSIADNCWSTGYPVVETFTSIDATQAAVERYFANSK